MGEIKTKVNDASVLDFINKIENQQRREDALVVLKLYEDITKEKAKMWGPAIIGFGVYHYKSEKSSQQGDWPLAAFSPRKQNLSLYVMPSWFEDKSLFVKLGKHTTSKACLYINKLSDINIDILKEIIKFSFEDSKKRLI